MGAAMLAMRLYSGFFTRWFPVVDRTFSLLANSKLISLNFGLSLTESAQTKLISVN
jgi:hypothetical protein